MIHIKAVIIYTKDQHEAVPTVVLEECLSTYEAKQSPQTL